MTIMTRRLAVMTAHGAATAAYQVAAGPGGPAANGKANGKGGGWLGAFLVRLPLDAALDELARFCWASPEGPAEAVLRKLHELARRQFTTLDDVPCELRVAATVFLAVVVPLGAEAEAADRAARKAAIEEAERQRQAAEAARPRRRDPAAGTIFVREEGI